MLDFRKYYPTLYVLVAVTLVGLFADNQNSFIEAQKERTRVQTQIEAIGAQTERALNQPIEAARGLVATLASEPNMHQARYEVLVRQTFATSNGIRNVAAARDLVVNLIYPVNGNEATIGLNYRRNVEQNEAIFRAIESGKFVLAGPIELVQGGQAFVGRFPIFNDAIEKRNFWGILSVVIDLPTLYQDSGIATSGLDLALVGKDGSGVEGERFLGSEALIADDPAMTEILFPNGSWKLFARPLGGWGSTQSVVFFRTISLVIGVVAICLAALANYMALQRKISIDRLKVRECELECARQEVENLARHDYLTALPNRRYLDDELGRMANAPLIGLIQMDLDGFKAVNDTRGHIYGDRLLQDVAKRLKSALPAGSFLARNGGDEFVAICLSDSAETEHRAELENVAQKLIKSIQKPFQGTIAPCRIGLSAGIHQVLSNEPHNPQEWLSRADSALYCAKQEGRNRYSFSKAQSVEFSSGKLNSDDLLEALSQGEILPYYQPQFGPNGRNIVGVEALARWEHPELGTLLPGVFMPLASSLKLDSVIDQHMFEHAISDLEHWDRAGLSVPQLSVNVSFRRLRDPQLVNQVDATGVAPNRIAFELLESIYLDGEDDLISKNVSALKSRGFAIEIDDFGAGHSSATSLLKLRPHCLKIEKGLVQAATSSRENRRLLATIAEMGHALNIKVCAEGIETSAHLVTAQAVGCTRFQGFLLGRPMTADAFEKLMYSSILKTWRSADAKIVQLV